MDGRRLVGALLAAMAVLIVPASVYAASQTALRPDPAVTGSVKSGSKPVEQAQPPNFDSKSAFKAFVRATVDQEVRKTGLPADIADAVVYVESNYNPSVIGGVGEIGLMQIRPETAAMLGFKGTVEELAKPETNIRYGVMYLSKAWRLANGDLCRALMKYRAGHGEDTMSPLSEKYCRRARKHLAALGSPFAAGAAPDSTFDPELAIAREMDPKAAAPKFDSPKIESPKAVPNSPTAVYARYKQGTATASRAFWAAHEARVRAIKSRIESKWRRVASR